jgi:hypothetical protein
VACLVSTPAASGKRHSSSVTFEKPAPGDNADHYGAQANGFLRSACAAADGCKSGIGLECPGLNGESWARSRRVVRAILDAIDIAQ